MRDAADDRDRHRAGDPAAGLVPAGDRRRRGDAGGAGGRVIASAPSTSPICFAGSGRSRLRLAAKSRVSAFDSDAGAVAALQKAATSTSGTEAGQGRGARPVPPSADAAGIARLRRRRVRSAAAGRAGAGDAARGQQGAGRGRGVLQRRDVCARRAHPDRWRLHDSRASRRSTSSATRRMSNWWRGLCAEALS